MSLLCVLNLRPAANGRSAIECPIPTLASNANSLDFRGENEFSGAQNPLINTRFNTTNRIRAYRRNPGLNRSHHSNSLSFKLMEAL